jgi:hypothetical protein
LGADEVDQRLPKLGVEFLGRSCDSEWSRECLVLIVLQFLGDDVYTDLIVFGGGYGHQDGAMRTSRSSGSVVVWKDSSRRGPAIFSMPILFCERAYESIGR